MGSLLYLQYFLRRLCDDGSVYGVSRRCSGAPFWHSCRAGRGYHRYLGLDSDLPAALPHWQVSKVHQTGFASCREHGLQMLWNAVIHFQATRWVEPVSMVRHSPVAELHVFSVSADANSLLLDETWPVRIQLLRDCT